MSVPGLPLTGATLSMGDPEALKSEKVGPLEASSGARTSSRRGTSSLWALRTQHPSDQIPKRQPCAGRAEGSSPHLLGQERLGSSYPFEEPLPRNTRRSILRTGYFSTWHMPLIYRAHGTLPRLRPFPSSSTHDPVRLAQARGPGQPHTQPRPVSLGGRTRETDRQGEGPAEPAAHPQEPAKFLKKQKSPSASPEPVVVREPSVGGHGSWLCSTSAEWGMHRAKPPATLATE